jgi:hypothetical protein
MQGKRANPDAVDSDRVREAVSAFDAVGETPAYLDADVARGAGCVSIRVTGAVSHEAWR